MACLSTEEEAKPSAMRFLSLLVAFVLAAPLSAQESGTPDEADVQMLRRLYDAALENSPAYEQLRVLTEVFPGRLSGTPAYDGAAQWTLELLRQLDCDRTELQPVMVPYWERGSAESVQLLGGGTSVPLAALALGGSVPTPADGLTASVVEVHGVEALKSTDVRGKIVFFNAPMNPTFVNAGRAYGEAGAQRNRGPTEASRHGAVAVVVRSLTHALDDEPHTGSTTYLPDLPRIPAAALSTLAANRLSDALRADPTVQLKLTINSTWHPDAPSANVIGEIRGSEFPEQVILVGGHLDSWDISPGAHDDGTGCIQSIEVLRLLKAVGYQPRFTIRCVLFANEENGLRGALEYARVAGEKKEHHALALETDSGGYRPTGFNLGNAAGDAHLKAARWKSLFEPYGVFVFQAGRGGADVGPLMAKGNTVAGLMPDSQQYFDVHHTRADSIDKVHRREFELGAAAMAALVYLVDRHGL
ncbi:MAG: M28 family peptidase [Candidatus Didemnitutus sp.]|nr:M28 family peptidase [Candidatus Didemnitutus sp.]